MRNYYRGWQIWHAPHNPQTGRYKARRHGVEMCAGSQEALEAMIRARDSEEGRYRATVHAQAGTSYGTMERLWREGVIDAVAWQWFRLFWLWSSPRYSGTWGDRHDRAYKALGRAGYHRRLNKVRAMCGLEALT